MRLLIVTQKINKDDPILGFFHRWVIEFAKHCEMVSVVCLEEGPHELPANVRVFSLGKEHGRGRIARTVSFYKYIRHLRHEYDAVFIHMNPIYAILGGLIWKSLGKTISLWYTHKHVDFKLKLAEKLVDRIFTASTESFRLSSNKVIVTGHGIDTDYFVPNPDREVVTDNINLITVGRMSSTKRIQEIVEAVGLLHDKGISVSLNVIGDGVTSADKEYAQKVRSLASKLGIAERCTFVGSLAPYEIMPYLQSANFFINMSSTGSLDKAVLEAMACGVVPVSSNEAFRDILEPHGLYFTDQTGQGCADAVTRAIALDKESIASVLREWVVSKHSLHNLVPLLVNYLSR